MTNKMKEFKERCKKTNDEMINNGIEWHKARQEEYDKCRAFFDELSEHLKEEYVVVESCNKDLSAYLVKKGTEDQISYYGKPEGSFRVSDHWNWYSNLKRCNKEDEVQCYNVDVPRPRQRDQDHPDKGTKSRKAAQVAIYSNVDHRYHAVYGVIWNQKKHKYDWYENDVEKVAKLYTVL